MKKWISIFLSLFLSLVTDLSFSLSSSIHLSLFAFFLPSIHPFHPSIHPIHHLSFHPSFFLFINRSINPSIHPISFIPFILFIHQLVSFFPSIHFQSKPHTTFFSQCKMESTNTSKTMHLPRAPCVHLTTISHMNKHTCIECSVFVCSGYLVSSSNQFTDTTSAPLHTFINHTTH